MIALALQVLSTFYVDVLWFREVGYSGVFWGIIRAKSLLAFAFGLVFFAVLYANLLIVRALTPTFRALTPEQEIVERYRLALEPYLRWVLPLFAIVIGLLLLVLLLLGRFPGWATLGLIPLLLLQQSLALGLGVALGVLNVFFRDVGHVTAIGDDMDEVAYRARAAAAHFDA